MLSDRERRVTEAIDDDRLLAFLSDLVAIPSTCGRETPAQERMAAEMEAAGLQARTWQIDLDALRSDPDWNTECEREEALGVVGRLGDGPGPRLILNGHVDVVPEGAPESWSSPPFTADVRDGMVYGRGALDMKGSLASAMAALRAIAESRIPLNGQVQFQSVVGEEDGGTGTLACLLEGYTADAAIVMEPTDMVVAPAQAGALDFRITIPGRSAHGALRAEGVSALDKARSVLDALRDLESTRNEAADDPLFAEWEIPFAISVGTVRGGEWASTVPDRLVLDGRYGLPPGEAPAEARRLFEETIRDAALKDPWLAGHPPRVEWWGGQFEPARIAADHRIVRTAAEALEAVRGTPARLAGMPYGSDLRLLVNRGGIPGILFGPGDIRRAHRPDECVSLRDLQDYARILAVTILRFCA